MLGWDRRPAPETPRQRRLRNDLVAMEGLRDESSVLRFKATGKPAQHYTIEFRGRSLARHRGKIVVNERHQVEIKLGQSYPRTMPELRWLTPIYHPNISEIGMVCLGGYGTHWVPSLNLDELVTMLWDMARYHNYDVRSPYNRDAALWVANQSSFAFPLDHRPLRDLRAALGRVAPPPPPAASSSGEVSDAELDGHAPADPAAAPPAVAPEASPSPASAPVAGSAPADADGLIILELDEPHAPPPPPPPGAADRPVRLRAQDEEIVFIE